MVATVIFAIVGFIFVFTAEPEPPTPQVTFYEISNQTDAERITVEANADSVVEGDLVISADRARAVLRLKSLPEINADQVFQLWLVDEDGAVNGGIQPMPEGYALFFVIPDEHPIDNYVRLGVSLEPAGGSPYDNAPSGDRVFQVYVPPPTES
jgi:anti-sigma-K factor RskA